MMRLSPLGLSILKHYEGKGGKPVLKAYRCPGGEWTIGFGTILYPNNAPVRQGDRCTPEQAEAYLQHDVRIAETTVRALFHDDNLAQHQFDALVCFRHNCGVGAISNSSLQAYIQKGGRDRQRISDLFCAWHFADGRRLDGLLARRSTEAFLFNTGQVRFFEL